MPYQPGQAYAAYVLLSMQMPFNSSLLHSLRHSTVGRLLIVWLMPECRYSAACSCTSCQLQSSCWPSSAGWAGGLRAEAGGLHAAEAGGKSSRGAQNCLARAGHGCQGRQSGSRLCIPCPGGLSQVAPPCATAAGPGDDLHCKVFISMSTQSCLLV